MLPERFALRVNSDNIVIASACEAIQDRNA
jgi:hypothetical protein